MKTIIILGALVISTGAFAQGRIEKVEKQISTPQTEIKEQAVKGQKDVREKIDQGNQQVSQKKEQADKIKGQAKDKVKNVKDEVEEKSNNGNAFGKDKVEATGKEFGQNRSAEAKLKATKVKTKTDAEAMISTSKEETKETMGNVDSKMVSARTKLAEKLASGELTKVQVDEKMAQLVDLEKRKNAIISEMK